MSYPLDVPTAYFKPASSDFKSTKDQFENFQTERTFSRSDRPGQKNNKDVNFLEENGQSRTAY